MKFGQCVCHTENGLLVCSDCDRVIESGTPMTYLIDTEGATHGTRFFHTKCLDPWIATLPITITE